MKFSNPITLLLLMVTINALLLAVMCFSVREQVPQAEEKTKILVLGVLSFVSTASLAAILGTKLINNFIEPVEHSASKMMAVIERSESKKGAANTEKSAANTENGAANSESSKDLSAMTELLVTELETSRQRERLIADYSSDILCCLDEKRRLLDLNIQSESVWEYQIISLLATPLDSLVCREDREVYLQYFDSCKIQNPTKPLECRVQSRTGKLIDLEWQVEWSPTSQNFFCLAKNISDRKENQRLKAEITAMVGHDLRAPVSSLSFLLDNLVAGTFGALSKEAGDKVEKARDNVQQMLKLISQLLDAEKLEGGQMEVENKIIPLCELYESSADLLVDLAERRQIALKFPEDSTILAMADFDRCLQVLGNLLSNAIKWSPAGSEIVVAEIIDRNFVTIQVIDKGPGIATDRQQTIFERFKSLDLRAEKTLASSGLGLYIAKKLTELQGGSIGVSSKIGEGSTFWFSLRQVHERELPGYLDG